MAWLSQVPGGHPVWAEPDSDHERVLRRLGYEDCPAPGADDPDDDEQDDTADTDDDPPGTA